HCQPRGLARERRQRRSSLVLSLCDFCAVASDGGEKVCLMQRAACIQMVNLILCKQSGFETVRDLVARNFLRLHASVAPTITAACDCLLDDIPNDVLLLEAIALNVDDSDAAKLFIRCERNPIGGHSCLSFSCCFIGVVDTNVAIPFA